MILRKPYALIIKYFKLIHLFLSVFIGYCIYKINAILIFLNNFLSAQNDVIGQKIQDSLYVNLMFIVPIIILLISFALLCLMIKKKKPYKFYLYNTIIYIAIFVIIIYTYLFLGRMEEKIVDLADVKAIRDILIIILGIQGISLIISVIRTIGLDIKEFGFMTDLKQLELSEEDREEFEVEFSIDSNERKRKLRRKLRYLKYEYKENKLFINTVLVVIVIIIGFVIYKRMGFAFSQKKEGQNISTGYYEYLIENSYLTNTDYQGNKITDNYLLVLSLKVRTISKYDKLLTGNFKVQVGNNKYSTTNIYDKQLVDLGITYKDDTLTSESANYLLVYEIPTSEIKKNIKLVYYEDSKSYQTKLKPIKDTIDIKQYNLGENIQNNELNNIMVNGYELSDKYTIDYDYCIKGECFHSIQNIVPKLNTNYDKVILKILGNYEYNEESRYSNFDSILSILGTIEYRINDQNKVTKIEKISNLKSNQPGVYYFEVNNELLNADSIKLVIHTRKCKYYYILK